MPAFSRARSSRIGRLADQRGYTLVELMVAMTMSVVVLAAGVWGVSTAFKQSTQTTDRAIAASRAEVGLEQLISDLRDATPCVKGLAISGAGSTLTGNSTDQAGIIYASGPILEMCDPAPGLTTSGTNQFPSSALVVWTYCASVGGSCTAADTWTRQVYSISGTTASSPSTTKVVFGVLSPTLTGLTSTFTSTSSTAATTSTLSAGDYFLNAASSYSGSGTLVSWVGVSASIADLSNPQIASSSVEPNTTSIPFQTGTQLRNYGA
jgi:prepilin-type N-terminal cleavage/methylation domain-containing protein